MLRLFDTAKAQVVDVALREPGKVSLYVCGPTPYDLPHVGHGRMLLVYDVLCRYLEWRGYEVRFVSNVTDIEDKIIARANQAGMSTDEVVAVNEDAWFAASRALGVRPPDAVPHATEYVERMVDYISGLIDRHGAYETNDGVYFSVASLSAYGGLSGQSLDNLRSGAGLEGRGPADAGSATADVQGEVGGEKRAPFDFALWKRAKPGEPSWPSPWRDGRPGWHIECTVMALDLLGDEFDLHGAGSDLVFPHNENERAQALAAGHPFARHWMHHGMVETGGRKLARSAGNYTSLTDLLARTDPRAYRLLVLRSHYRTPIEVTPTSLADAEAALERFDAVTRRIAAVDAAPDDDVITQFTDAMDDDLDSPRGVSLLFDAIRRANAAADAGHDDDARRLVATVREIGRAVGLFARDAETAVDDETAAIVARRDEARRARDFATSDALRADLEARGWVVEDTAQGTMVRR